MSYLATIFIIGGLIFVHEWGHLLAARWAGISIARFSIGFGPRIWTRHFNGVEYCVALIPLGGYVLPRIESEEEFFRIPAARRIVFCLGGPIANFVSAGLLLAIVHCIREGISPSGLLIEPWKETVRQSLRFILALPSIFAHPDQLSGVVGIVAVGKSVLGNGFVSTLQFAVLLNLNLAILNLLPLAPLDGGKIFCALLEKIHPRLARLHDGFALAGLMFLAPLMAYTTVLDVLRQLA